MAAPPARRSIRRSEDVAAPRRAAKRRRPARRPSASPEAPPRIVVTSGEPAGIGPDLCVMLAERAWDAAVVVAGDAALLAASARALGRKVELERYDPARPARAARAGVLEVLEIALAVPVRPGELDRRNAPYVIGLLDRACDGCLSGEFEAMVTAPVQKSILIEAGYDFPGHTEYLAARTGAPLPVMLLASGTLRVALVTTHLPLAHVPAAITPERLEQTIRIVHRDLERRFGIAAPRIAVLGLNPHAGESGHLGREEIEVIAPVLERLRAAHLDLKGPVPADTAFTARFLAEVDVLVAMYHDQGLPALKALSFGEAVNVTLGLPIARTSVDHGTALDLARSGKADPGSLVAALECALGLARRAASVRS